MFKVGDLVTIKNYAKQWNGKKAVIKRIDGSYHYVMMLGYTHETELYPCEMELVGKK